MEIHLLKAVLIFMIAFIVVVGGLINLCGAYLPAYIQQTFRCGKHAYVGKKPYIPPIEVPKRWFQHFYIFSSILSFASLILAFLVYGFKYPVPHQIILILDVLGTKERVATVSSWAVLTALVLITAQCWRRLFETQFISVFSDTRMNLSHYFVGFLHYFLTVTSVLLEAPGFIRTGTSKVTTYPNWYQVLAVGLFIFAYYVQYQTAVILANLRKTKTGAVNFNHVIPVGGLFKLVSSPHYLAEVLIYFSLTVILWGNTTFVFVVLWVLSNQVESALLTHWWYKSKFKEYPRERAAIFPFVL